MTVRWLLRLQLVILLAGLAYCDNNASSRRASFRYEFDYSIHYPINRAVYLYLLDIEDKYSSVLLDYGYYGYTRNRNELRYYLASRIPDGPNAWEVRDLTDDYERFSRDLIQQVNKRLRVPLHQDDETEIKLIATVDNTNYSSLSIFLKRPEEIESADIQIVNVSSNTLDALVTWNNPPTTGSLRITGNKFWYKIDPDTFHETYAVKDSTSKRTYEKLLLRKPLPTNENSVIVFAVLTENIVGTGGRIDSISRPRPPRIKVQKLELTDGDPLSKDYTFTCINTAVQHQHDMEDLQELQVYQNRFERRDLRPGGEWSLWYRMSPATVPVEDVFNLVNSYTFSTNLLVDACQFRALAHAATGTSMHSDVVSLYGPLPPSNLRLVRIGINEEDYSKRDFELEWDNPPDSEKVNPMLRNILEYRVMNSGATWYPVVSSPLYIDRSKGHQDHRRHTFMELPEAFYEFRMKVENYVTISNASNVVAVEPLVPIKLKKHLRLVYIGISETNTEKNPLRDFVIGFRNPNHGLNKVRKVIFQYRGKEKFYNFTEFSWYLKYGESIDIDAWEDDFMKKHWGPWIDTKPIKIDPDETEGKGQIFDVPLVKYNLIAAPTPYTALEIRIVALGYIGSSEPSESFYTYKPSVPELSFTRMYLIKPRSEEEDDQLTSKGLLYDRIFEFGVIKTSSEFYDYANKITQLVFEYRVSQDSTGPTRESWQSSKPIHLDIKKLSREMLFDNNNRYNVTVNFKKSQRYLAVEFRAVFKALFGTSEPSHVVTLDLPSAPSELNYIYYGSDISCRYEQCKLELDWKKSNHGGTIGISKYVIQHKKRSSWNYWESWQDLLSVPETGLQYRRQLIVMDYSYVYRVVARNILGDSTASNVLWETPFSPYHLRVDYRRPGTRNSVTISLAWEKMSSGIQYYTVQTNWFLLHDTRAMVDVITVNYKTLSAKFTADIQFLDYAKVDQSIGKFYLPEFRVISKYADNITYGPSSCTTFVHFDLDEFNSKGASLKGYMP